MRDLFLNQRCLLCASHKGGRLGLCDACLDDLPWHDAPHCPQCGLLSNGLLCGNCLNATPSSDATLALFTYDYPLDRLLQHYKYQQSLSFAKTFASLWLDKPPANITGSQDRKPEIDLIIPMSMHKDRLQQRGFNQALEIARLISKHRQIKLDYTSCQRTRLTPPQASLPLNERIKNIQGVFQCDKNLQGLNIALVDDVMTTGASLNELAKTLKQAGAAHVECWVIARTLPQPN